MEKGQAQRRVLVVDDESAVRSLLTDRLSQEGYACQGCSSAKEALELLGRESFDLIISDLNMPGMSGLEFLEEAHKKYPHSAFLMATGENNINVGVQAMKQGAS